MKKLIVPILIFLIVIIGFVYYIFTDQFKDTVNAKTDYTVKALDLLKEFSTNDSVYNKKYAEKIIVVNGKVGEIEMADTSLNIKMIDTLTNNYIIFEFQKHHINEVQKLKVGDSVAIKGCCSGGIHSDILETNIVAFKRSTIVINK